MGEFNPGLELCRQFFEAEVQPIVDSHFRGLKYSAALIGSGSEVLGFDTPMSTDHDWGPRVMLFISLPDHARLADAIRDVLTNHLPVSFRSYSTSFGEPDPTDNGTHLPASTELGAVRHRVDVQTIRHYAQEYLGFDVSQQLGPADWLSIPEQKLRAFTTGAVYRDEVGLRSQRDRFAYYPRDIWLYQLAATWTRIGQEEHLMGRAGQVGDELGSALIAARLVRDIMRLCFLYARQYAPYAKWFGTAFAKLESARSLQPMLLRVLAASSWQDRDRELLAAYDAVARLHANANLTKPLPTSAMQFFNRPFHVIAKHGFAGAIQSLVADPALKKRAIGGIDLISDNTDLLCDTSFREPIRKLYD